jgi:hypothetical protein
MRGMLASECNRIARQGEILKVCDTNIPAGVDGPDLVVGCYGEDKQWVSPHRALLEVIKVGKENSIWRETLEVKPGLKMFGDTEIGRRSDDEAIGGCLAWRLESGVKISASHLLATTLRVLSF